MEELTAKQRRFIEEYLIDLNGTQAAIRAGYSENSASEMAYENLNKPQIVKYIQIALEERSNATQIDAEYVLRRLKEIDELDVADLFKEDGAMIPILQWPKVWRTSISGIDIAEMGGQDSPNSVVLKKIKWPDKAKNLEMLGKHVNVQAWGDKKDDEIGHANVTVNLVRDKLRAKTTSPPI